MFFFRPYYNLIIQFNVLSVRNNLFIFLNLKIKYNFIFYITITYFFIDDRRCTIVLVFNYLRNVIRNHKNTI